MNSNTLTVIVICPNDVDYIGESIDNVLISMEMKYEISRNNIHLLYPMENQHVTNFVNTNKTLRSTGYDSNKLNDAILVSNYGLFYESKANGDVVNEAKSVAEENGIVYILTRV